MHFVTLATADLAAAQRFYVDGLGWSPLLEVPGEVLFFQVAPGLVLSLFDSAAFTADLGRTPGATPVSGVTLSHNVDSPERVRAVVAAATAAGATVLKEPQGASWGGYQAHVADPNGVVWEIAYNPGWAVAADGTVRLQAVE